jgi:hypothetical protein
LEFPVELWADVISRALDEIELLGVSAALKLLAF